MPGAASAGLRFCPVSSGNDQLPHPEPLAPRARVSNNFPRSPNAVRHE
jgi:hypothetical protein